MRLNWQQWAKLKPRVPFCQLPVLEFGGSFHSQSNAILRYIGKKTGLYPDSDIDALRVDETIDTIDDLVFRIIPTLKEQDMERKLAMRAYGAELVEVSAEAGMEGARDLAEAMEQEGRGRQLNQFSNPDNPLAHYRGTGPELWQQTAGEITHLVSSMGTTGTIMGCSAYLKAQNPAVQIVGLQPTEGASIPGIRRWPAAYLPKIFEPARVDRVMDISQEESEETMRRLAAEEGIFCGVSAGGSVAGALRLSAEVENATIVAIICDRGDRYLSTGVFGAGG